MLAKLPAQIATLVTSAFALAGVFAPNNPSATKLVFFRYALTELRYELFALALVFGAIWLLQSSQRARGAVIWLWRWLVEPTAGMSNTSGMIYVLLIVGPTVLAIWLVAKPVAKDALAAYELRRYFYNYDFFDGLRAGLLDDAKKTERTGKIEQAIERYKRIAAVFPDDPRTAAIEDHVRFLSETLRYSAANLTASKEAASRYGDSREAFFPLVEALRANPADSQLQSAVRAYFEKVEAAAVTAAKMKEACTTGAGSDVLAGYQSSGKLIFEAGVRARLTGEPPQSDAICGALAEYTEDDFAQTVRRSWQLDSAAAILTWAQAVSASGRPNFGEDATEAETFKAKLFEGEEDDEESEPYEYEEEADPAYVSVWRRWTRYAQRRLAFLDSDESGAGLVVVEDSSRRNDAAPVINAYSSAEISSESPSADGSIGTLPPPEIPVSPERAQAALPQPTAQPEESELPPPETSAEEPPPAVEEPASSPNAQSALTQPTEQAEETDLPPTVPSAGEPQAAPDAAAGEEAASSQPTVQPEPTVLPPPEPSTGGPPPAPEPGEQAALSQPSSQSEEAETSTPGPSAAGPPPPPEEEGGSSATDSSSTDTLIDVGDIVAADRVGTRLPRPWLNATDWPVDGRIVAGFGAVRGGIKNDGINIAAPVGAPVLAVADGVVAYAGNKLRGFGYMMLIRHSDGYVTAYTHASKLLLERGERVTTGQTIALVGQTGAVIGPQLHFEIRLGTKPVNPLFYLRWTARVQPGPLPND